jgi:exodeoxyribonuclease V alpha subunit
MSDAPVSTRSESLEHLNGLIERITFHNAESGFAVLQVKVRGHKDLITVLGTLPEVKAGEFIDAQGRWVIDREYGRQFRTVVLRTAPPNTAERMKKYLASGLIKGIGPAFAGRLVDAFGVQVFEVIELTPHRLLEVNGIGKGRHAKIVSAWNDQKAVREIMVFLHSHGVSTSRAFRIYKTYGQDAIAKVSEDPYPRHRATSSAPSHNSWNSQDDYGYCPCDVMSKKSNTTRHRRFRRLPIVVTFLIREAGPGCCKCSTGGLNRSQVR